MKKEFDFAKEFGEIDEKLVENAGKEWKRPKCSVFQLYSRKIASVAVIAVLCLVVVLCNSSVQASVRSFTTKIGEAFGFTKDLSSYAEIVNQTQTVNGISLTLKEVIVDDRVLMVSVHTDAKQEMLALWINQEKTLINGEKHMVYETMETAGNDGDVYAPQRDTVLAQIYEDQILPEGEVNVHLVLEAGEADLEGGEGEAEFVYDFVITAEELKSKTIKQELEMVIGEPGVEKRNLTLKELTMNDLYCRITVTGITRDDDWANWYDLKLKGKDSLGNPVTLTGGNFISDDEMLFVTHFFGDYEDGEVIGEDELLMSVPDKDCEYLDLQLYERKIILDDTEEVSEDVEEVLEDVEGVLEDVEEVSDDTEEVFAVPKAGDAQEDYGWEPVGEPFCIPIKRNSLTQNGKENNVRETEAAHASDSTEYMIYQDVKLYRNPQPDQVCIKVEPAGIRENLYYYFIPAGEAQEKLKSYMDGLKDKWQQHDMRWQGRKEAGYQICYQGKEYMAFEDGCLYATDTDDERGVLESLVEEKELCEFVQQLLAEHLAYEAVDVTQIKDIVSAKLNVCSIGTNWEACSQTITDKATLELFEDWFQNATYIFGGADCGNNDSCLELTLANGEIIKLSLATDSCPNFGVNGVYYEYRTEPYADNSKFWECFDEIPWDL